jgi:glucose-1-phosphate adenylyltransferase
MNTEDVLAFVLCGGAGNRLMPLTEARAKPAVPFGGGFRIIDFVLSNCYNSLIRKVYLLTQYESSSLHNHVRLGWYPLFGFGPKGYLRMEAAAQGKESNWYLGTADAISQNVDIIHRETPSIVNIFAGDHVYLMDIRQMNGLHLNREADMTISAIQISRELAANKYGVLTVDNEGRLIGFEEKPSEPKPIPGNNEMCLTSMGNYAFKPDILLESLIMDGQKETRIRNRNINDSALFSSHDFGFDIIPSMLKAGKRIFAYNFNENKVPGATEGQNTYWRDIGDKDQFYDANMETRNTCPPINLYNPRWPIYTHIPNAQCAKIIGNEVQESLISNGCIVSNSRIIRSVLSYNTSVEGSTLEDSIALGDTRIDPGCHIVRTVIDKHTHVPSGVKIGVNRIDDELQGFVITENGITFVPSGFKFRP